MHARKAQSIVLDTVSKQLQTKEYDTILLEKLKKRLSLNCEETPRFIHLNFFTISRKLDKNGNSVHRFIVFLALPSGVGVDITYLVGRVFNYRVLNGGVLSGQIDASIIRRNLHERYGRELNMKLEEFYINQL